MDEDTFESSKNGPIKEEDKENEMPSQEVEQTQTTSYKQGPFIYTAQFSNKGDMIMAAGAGANQVRLFDYTTGNITCVISDIPKAVLCMAKANTSSEFAFGSQDSKIRIMQQKSTSDS